MNLIPSESHEQKIFTIILKKLKEDKKIIEFFAIPNGGLRSKSEAKRLELEGVNKGASDICIILKNKILFVEMKRIKKYKKSKEQVQFLENIKNSNVCFGSFVFGYIDACNFLNQHIEFDYNKILNQ